MGWVVNATPRLLYSWKRPGTHCTGGWVGLKAGLDGWKISFAPGFDPQTVQPVANPYTNWAIPDLINGILAIKPETERERETDRKLPMSHRCFWRTHASSVPQMNVAVIVWQNDILFWRSGGPFRLKIVRRGNICNETLVKGHILNTIHYAQMNVVSRCHDRKYTTLSTLTINLHPFAYR